MSELAFDREGQPFRFSRRTKKLRPRRWKNAGQRGTCAAVLDPDGEPLFIDADAEYLEFRAAVGNVPGFYRLDQVDEDGSPIEDAPPAYVSIESTRNAVPVGEVDPRDAIIRDLAQINADMTRTIAERFANVMQAAADVLRAADGAGLSRREPPPFAPPPAPEEDEDEDEDEEEPAPPTQPFGSLQPLVEMAMPHLPTFGAFLWAKFQEFMKQNATPSPMAAPSPAHGPIAPEAPSPGPEPGSVPSAAATSTAPPPPPPPPPPPAPVPNSDAAPAAHVPGGAGSVDPTPSIAPSPVAPSPSATPTPSTPPTTAVAAHPAAMAPPQAATTGTAQGDAPRNALGTVAPTPEQRAHLRAVLLRLSPRESAITETVVGRMPPEVRVQWLTELSALSVNQAVEAVRSMIPKAPTKPQTASSVTAMPPQAKPGPADAAAAVEPKLPPLSTQATAHFLAIQAALTPEEAASVRAAASALSPLELRALVDEFSTMSVPEAVERIRALLAGASNPEAA